MLTKTRYLLSFTCRWHSNNVSTRSVCQLRPLSRSRLTIPFYCSFSSSPGEEKWVLTQESLLDDPNEELWVHKSQGKQTTPLERRKMTKNNKTESSNNVRDESDLSKMKGFLQLNPHICSGCGSHFQSKSPDNPGYLEKERFSEHRIKAEKLKNIQDALKILDLAGIDPESDVAMDMLVKANVSQDIIEGVLEINQRMTKGLKKPNLNDFFPSSVSINNNSASIPSSKTSPNQITSAGRSPERRILGYHFRTLEPIYDEDTLLKSFSEEKYHESKLSALPQETKAQESKSQEYDDNNLPICQRCFRLQFYGQCSDSLRPGWTENEDLTPEKFQSLLEVIRESTGVVLCLIDIFDIEGSILPNIKDIAGKNPIVIVANKIDLLPNDTSMNRVRDWIYRTVRERCMLISPKEAEDADYKEYQDKGWYKSRENNEEGILRKSNIYLVSCTTGSGIQNLMTNILTLAKSHGDKIYVMGTANVGKSSFVNRLLKYTSNRKNSTKKTSLPQATVSPLPGTTLDFLKIKLPTGVQMIDTPGLINNSQLTSRLNTKELKKVIPTKQIHHVTLSMSQNYCVLIGGLAKIELVEVVINSMGTHNS